MHAVKWQRLFLSVALSLFGRVCIIWRQREALACNVKIKAKVPHELQKSFSQDLHPF